MKYNTPKELWNLYKELAAFQKKKEEFKNVEQIVFDLFRTKLSKDQINYSVSHPDNVIRWGINYDEHREGKLYYYQNSDEFILDATCYRLQEGEDPLNYVRFSNVFNNLLNKGKLFYFSNENSLRYQVPLSMHALYWQPEGIDDHISRHVNISDDISLCAHVMYSTGKDPFDVVADFVSSRQGEKNN